MAQTIKLKRSSTSGASPTTSQLALGEVAINTYDGKMYIKKDTGTAENPTESIVEIGAVGGYTLPVATSTVLGGIELFSNTDQTVAANTVTATTGRTYGIQLNSDNQAVVNVPWSDTNTTYSAGTGITLTGTTFSLTDTNDKLNLSGGTLTGKLTTNTGIEILYNDHASGAVWDTFVHVGKVDDASNHGNVAPVYQPDGSYGLLVQANSDGMFVGLEEEDSGHYNPVIKWGDDSGQGEDLFFRHADDTYVAKMTHNSFTVDGTISATSGNSTNWNTAYGWGDHAQAGYLTSYTDTNTTYSAGTGITLTGTTFSLTDTNDKLNLSGGTLTGFLKITDARSDGAPLLDLHNSTNGGNVDIRFTDVALGTSQFGNIIYNHQDSKSYGSGSHFKIGSSEETTTILADGKLMYKEGIYSKPATGTGAGTRKDANWDTAHGWGNHASAGYATQYQNFGAGDGDHDTHHWNKTHAAYSDNEASPTYIVLTTNVPQDNYSMGGFTLVFQNYYNDADEGDTVEIYGYWNPESNGGFVGFRYHTSNPECNPTIQVGRDSNGKTVFLISGESSNYAQVIAKDFWTGYNASSASSSWGDSWAFSEASATTGISNLNTLTRVGITATQVSNWNTAYGWGDHAQAGYLTSYTDTNTTYSAGTGLTLTGTTFSLTDTNDKLNLSGGTLTGGLTGTTATFVQQISANEIVYPLTIAATDFGNTLDQLAGDGVGLQFKLANNSSSGGSFLGGSITAVRGAAADANSTTNLEFYVSNDDETLDKALTINSDLSSDFEGTITATGYNDANWNTAYNWGDHSTESYATETYVDTAVSNLVDSAPGSLDTLNELAAALGEDANFSTTVNTNIATKLPLAGGTMTGTLTVDSGTSVGIKIDHDSFAKGLELHREDSSNSASIKFSNNSGESGIFYARHSDKRPIWRPGGTEDNHQIFTDNYHPNADKWTTARSHTVTLTGDVTGTATQSVDGTGNKTWSITTAVSNDSHNHNHSDSDFTVNGGLVVEGSKHSGASNMGFYESAGTNIILKGDANGRSGIFFESEKDGTNINDPSDYGFIQYHPYGYGGTSGESADFVIGVSNDSTDHVIIQSPYNGGVKVGYKDATSGTGLTTQTVFHDAYHPNADKWTTARSHTVTLTGEVTGTATQSVDGTGNKTWSIATTLGNTALDDQYIKRGTPSLTSNITTIASSSDIVRWNNSTAGRPAAGQANEYGPMLQMAYDGQLVSQLAHDFDQDNLYFRQLNTSTDIANSWEQIFHDTYHPNADKWTTARTNTVTLSNDVVGSGSASVDGSGNWTVAISADWQGGTANKLVNMNNLNITNVNHLTFNDPGPNEGLQWLGGSGWRIYESPDNLTTNSGGNLQFVTGSTRRVTIDTSGNLNVTGTLTATAKSFDIPHPSKEGMRLKHGVVEGPEHSVYVRGKSKEKVISLPDYWVNLVHEDTITVQLTAIGGGQDLYVEDINDNKVYVNGENYFYYIQAERKDVDRFEVEYGNNV